MFELLFIYKMLFFNHFIITYSYFYHYVFDVEK